MHTEELRNTLNSAIQTSDSHTSAVIPSSLDVTNSINSSSIVCPEYVISEGLLPGQRLDGRMSNVRRFFCLFVTFDLLFTALMWLICIMLTGESIWTAINKEIYHYNVHTSLFDIVLAALCRFTVLLLFYGLLHLNHWIIISLSTAGTCAFLIAKVFVFNWQDSPQPVFQVLLVLVSFILSWGEAWFLDFRVIPQESLARQIYISSPDTERAPLIRSYVQGLRPVPSEYTESVAHFHSVQGSPSGSLHRYGDNGPARFPVINLPADQSKTYRGVGEKASKEAWLLVNGSDWKLLKKNNGDSIYGKNVPNVRKIYKLTAAINVATSYLFEELYYQIDTMTEWNNALLESHKVHIIDNHTDITYQVSQNAARGVIKSRDFVTLRRWEKKGNCYFISSVGVDFPSVPKNEKYVRGENGVGYILIRPYNSEVCQLEWVLNSDLKGKIPKFVLESAFISMMFDYVKSLREHLMRRNDGL